jgi:hypothetical protein
VEDSYKGQNVSSLKFEQLSLAIRDNFSYRLHAGDTFCMGKVEYLVVETSEDQINTVPSKVMCDSSTIATSGVGSQPSINLRTTKTAELCLGETEASCRV